MMRGFFCKLFVGFSCAYLNSATIGQWSDSMSFVFKTVKLSIRPEQEGEQIQRSRTSILLALPNLEWVCILLLMTTPLPLKRISSRPLSSSQEQPRDLSLALRSPRMIQSVPNDSILENREWSGFRGIVERDN